MIISYQIEFESDYNVKNFGDSKEVEQHFILKKEAMHACCTSLIFEFEGNPCRHILCVLRQLGIAYLPQNYILKRWTIHARRGSVHDSRGVEIGSSFNESLVSRHNELSFFQCYHR